MFVRVVYDGLVKEVLIEDKAVASKAIKASGFMLDGDYDLLVSGVYICSMTPLRNNDVLQIVHYDD